MAIENINTETCIGCGTCVNTCPMDVLRMDPETGKSKIVYPDECQICRQCSNYCPVGDVITITDDKCERPMVGWG